MKNSQRNVQICERFFEGTMQATPKRVVEAAHSQKLREMGFYSVILHGKCYRKKKKPGDDLLSHTLVCSTIGDEELNF